MSDDDKDVPSRRQVQQRANEIRAFRAELSRVEAEGMLVLDDAQQQALQAHHESPLAQFARDHDIDRNTRARQLSLGMRVASFFGAMALAASVFFLFYYQFWGRFGETVQVSILLAAALGSLGLTVWVQGRDASGYITKLTALVAFARFVLNLSRIGQIFNITPSAKALLPWAVMAFLLAYACDLRLLLGADILCMIAFVAARAGTWSGVCWLSAGERAENVFAAATLLLAIRP